MDKHALAILTLAESWDWPLTRRIQQSGETNRGKFTSITPKLLSGFLAESKALGGTLLDQFWIVVGNCHPELKRNIENLKRTEFSSSDQSEALLFEGITREEIDFDPVFKMAAELFTYLGVAYDVTIVLNPGGRESGSGTPFSVSEIVGLETDELLKIATEEGLGKRKQEALKELSFKRDGQSCPLTGAAFNSDEGVSPNLAHVIPNAVHGKPDALKFIAMFAGPVTRDLVIQHLNGIGNVMNLEANANAAYDNLKWGIEAQNDANGMIKYIYRRLPRTRAPGPGYIRLRDGEEIKFGEGPEANRLGSGPNPLLCNLQYAVARVLKMSGAAEIIFQLMEDADDTDFPHVYLASEDFCNILTAKLLVSGRALTVM